MHTSIFLIGGFESEKVKTDVSEALYMLKHTNAKKARVSCRIRMESKQSEKPRPSTYDFWIRARKTTANDLDAPNFPQSSGWKH